MLYSFAKYKKLFEVLSPKGQPNTLKQIGQQFVDEWFECAWSFCGIDA